MDLVITAQLAWLSFLLWLSALAAAWWRGSRWR